MAEVETQNNLDFERKHEEDLRRIRDFRLMDDNFMSKVFEDKLRGHLPPRAHLPGSILRAFCQAQAGRTLLVKAVRFLPKGHTTPLFLL